ncbi:MAG: hypothetical protein IJ733_03540 [Lachnospiraceae bacterium]|nr:hypothetical protein [Lachnospiraceae bacterium]
MVQPFVSNVLSNKYDTALDFHITMYDELPYQRDSDYCGREQIAMHSNKLLKYYLYMFEDISVIDNGDEAMEEYLSGLQLKEINQARLSGGARKKAERNADEVTEEQIKTLLDDSENPMNSAGTVNDDPFAGVEDW